MKKSNILVILSFVAILFSCNKPKKTIDDPHQGVINVAVDESFKSVAEALTQRYVALNQNTKINLEIKKEDLALLDLLDNKVRAVVMSRDLNEKEKKAYEEKIGLEFQPAKFAADAVVFVVPKNSTRESISMEELKKELYSDKKNIIFDGTNSSNLNFVAQKIGATPDQLKFSIISGNKNVLQEINKYPEKIGAVGLNTISRPYDKESLELRDAVKILTVVEDGVSYQPEISNLKEMTYPFTRVLYFLTNETYYGLGNGFIRFSCQQLGQIVVEKEGLQPYNIFKREVQMR
jgi:phosphate transport system substrate-binding protein